MEWLTRHQPEALHMGWAHQLNVAVHPYDKPSIGVATINLSQFCIG